MEVKRRIAALCLSVVEGKVAEEDRANRLTHSNYVWIALRYFGDTDIRTCVLCAIIWIQVSDCNKHS